jgi:DnaK suppressor protein
MPAKKPVGKAVKPKKPVARKAPAAKRKPVPAKAAVAAKPKPGKAASKPVVKTVAAKPAAAKPAPKVPTPIVSKPQKVTVPTSKTAPKASVPKTSAPKPEAPKPARPVAPESRTALLSSRATAVDGDEEGFEASTNLLAGPRNVKPYLAKKGEEYMNKEQLEHFQKILSTWKRDLMEEVDRTVTHMKDEAANPPDPIDRATLESEFSLELRTRDRERKLIRKIDEALKRIEDGSYGYCLETGEEIGIKRLEARPVATLSIEAQERRERREKQYGDRDDRYR